MTASTAASGESAASTPSISHVPSPTTCLHLGERPVAAPDREHGVRGAHHEGVASLAEAGRDRDVHERVGGRAVGPGQDADGRPAGVLRAPAGGLHDAAEPSADEHDAA
jgi:hypothetical protein